MARPKLTASAMREIRNTIKGIFAVNKPKNSTTSDTIEMLRLQISDDVGFSVKSSVPLDHGGTLEYPAEGVLVIALGLNAKKKIMYFKRGEKRYNVTIKLGQATDTYDALGTVTEEKSYDHINRLQIEDAVKQFIGPRLLPLPSVKALQMDGIQVSNPEKKMSTTKFVPVAARSICCADFNPPYVSFEVIHQKPFFVRTFAHEIGKVLGSCAHISSMERTVHGVFTTKDALPTYRWSWNCIQEAIQNANEKANSYVLKAKSVERQEEK